MDNHQRRWVESLTGARLVGAADTPDTSWFALAFPGNSQARLEGGAEAKTGNNSHQRFWYESDDEEETGEQIQKDAHNQSLWYESDDEEETGKQIQKDAQNQSRWRESDDEEETGEQITKDAHNQSLWYESDDEEETGKQTQKDAQNQSRWRESDDEEETGEQNQKEVHNQSRWYESNSEEGIERRGQRVSPHQSRRLNSDAEITNHALPVPRNYTTSEFGQNQSSGRRNLKDYAISPKNNSNLGSDNGYNFGASTYSDVRNFATPRHTSGQFSITQNDHAPLNMNSPTRIAQRTVSDDNATREQAVLSRIRNAHSVLMNNFESGGAGWATNLLHATAREASITWIATMIRETLGYFAAQELDGMSDHTKVAISSAILSLTGILNVIASVRQEAQQKANWTTRAAHASTLALLGGATAIAHQTTGLGSIAPLLLKATGYCLSRDGINLFVRLSSNRNDSVNLKSIATEMTAYAVNQYIVNELQSAGLSLSGTSAEAQALSYREIFGRLAGFAAANAAGETFDAFGYPTIVAFYNDIGSGIQTSLKAAAGLRLAAKFRLPMGANLVARFPAAEGIVEGVGISDAVDTIFGPMTARQSVFVILYSMLSLLSKAGAAARFSPEGTSHLVNALAGISVGLLGSVFLGALATSSPPSDMIQPEVV